MRELRGKPLAETAQEAADLFIGREVRVYRNLNTKGVVWSLKDRKTGLVIGYAESVNLAAVYFRVSEAGRQRVIREKRKNVHAYADGTVCCPPSAPVNGKPTTYNPYKAPTFVLKERELPLKGAQYAYLGQLGVVAFGALWTPVAQ